MARDARARLAAAVRAQADALIALAATLEVDDEPAPASTGDELLSLRKTGLPLSSVRSAIRRGELPAVRVGRELRIRRSDLDRWINTLPGASTGPATPPSDDVDDAINRMIARGKLRAIRGGR